MHKGNSIVTIDDIICAKIEESVLGSIPIIAQTIIEHQVAAVLTSQKFKVTSVILFLHVEKLLIAA